MKNIGLVIVFILVSCVSDYRTDYEKNHNIILTEEQIEFRKEQKKARLKAIRDRQIWEEDQARLREMLNCNRINQNCI